MEGERGSRRVGGGKQHRVNLDGGWGVIFGGMGKGRNMMEVSSCVSVAVQDIPISLKFLIWNSSLITHRHTISPV